MKRKKDYRDSLLDNLNAIRDVDDFVKDMDLESLVKNKEKLCATIYCLHVIGDVVKSIPAATREKYQEIPWRKIARIRDRLPVRAKPSRFCFGLFWLNRTHF